MKRICELCFVGLPATSTWTVCHDCDESMRKQFLAEDREKARKHAAKYKCRQCARGLPLTRRLDCESCVPPELRPVDDVVWEQLEVWDGGIEYRPPVAEKHCPLCNVTKPATEFSRNNNRADRLYMWCKPCHNTHQRNMRVAKRSREEARGL